MRTAKLKHHVSRFWKALWHPSVIVFFILGAGVIFLTFLTSNNALEIAIAGVASVFIGIGVNNVTSLEEKQKREGDRKRKSYFEAELFCMVCARAARVKAALADGEPEQAKADCKELLQLLELYGYVIGTSHTPAADKQPIITTSV